MQLLCPVGCGQFVEPSQRYATDERNVDNRSTVVQICGRRCYLTTYS